MFRGEPNRKLSGPRANTRCAGAGTPGTPADAPNGKVVLALIGIGSTVPGSVGGRGRQLLRPFGGFKDVEIAYLCDIDKNFYPFGQKILADQGRRLRRWSIRSSAPCASAHEAENRRAELPQHPKVAPPREKQ